jgi:hypothetical protein
VLFEARELKPYAEPVSPSDLLEGEVYFSVQYADERLLVPIVEPLIFVGRNLAEGDEDLLYFQNFESYSIGVRYDPANQENGTDFHVRGPEDLKHIFEYEKALNSLMSCALRRREGARGTKAK